MTDSTTNNKFKVIGTRPIRHDGADKVTGRALYGADFSMARISYGKILRSPHAHAKIKSIDTSKAEKIQGVLSIMTGKDISNTKKFSRGGQKSNFGRTFN